MFRDIETSKSLSSKFKDHLVQSDSKLNCESRAASRRGCVTRTDGSRNSAQRHPPDLPWPDLRSGLQCTGLDKQHVAILRTVYAELALHTSPLH